MTQSAAELNDLFDLLYNNLANDGASNIDMFEKSMLLTKAQEEVVYNHLQALGNKYQQGAESSDKRMLELAPLLDVWSSDVGTISNYAFNSQAYRFEFYMQNKFFIKVLNEIVLFDASKENVDNIYRQVLPISYGEYERYSSKPGGEPLKNQVWKVSTEEYNSIQQNTYFFVFNQNDIENYVDKPNNYTLKIMVKGYRKPTPIILEPLDGNLTIDGESQQQDFFLPMLKNEIVQRAVEIAKGSYATDENGSLQLQNQMALGQRSE